MFSGTQPVPCSLQIYWKLLCSFLAEQPARLCMTAHLPYGFHNKSAQEANLAKVALLLYYFPSVVATALRMQLFVQKKTGVSPIKD